jgi:DNA-binding NarL/FixJ family response regulator
MGVQEWRMPEIEPDRTLRILVVDDHDIVRQGIAALLERQPGYDVVAQAGTAADAVAAANRFVPDLVILDVGLPDGSGIETCREIKARHPETRVVILTGSADEDTVLTAVVAGANGYLLKSSGVREVMHAIDVVAAGGSLLDPVATDRLVRRIRRFGEGAEADPLAGLAARERRILELIAAGHTNKEIASEIKLSEKTVKRSVSVILSKLNLERRGQAAALFAGRGPFG